MAIRTTTGGGENVVISAAAVAYMQLLLADRLSLRGHPALINLGAYGAGRLGGGSTSHTFPLFGLDGYDLLTATANEVSSVSETALTTAAKTIAVARHALRRDLSDFMHAVDPTGQLNPMRLAQSGFNAAMATFTNKIAALMSGFSNQVGSTGVDMDHDLWMEAKGTLIDNLVPGPYIAMLAPSHFSQWISDLESRGGVTQWRPATAELQVLRGPGFQGTFDGVEVFTTTRVPTSSGDRISGMFGAGAIGYAEQQIELPNSSHALIQAGPIACEEERSATEATTKIVTHYYVGVGEIEDDRGVGILAAA